MNATSHSGPSVAERVRKLRVLAVIPALFAIFALGRFVRRYDFVAVPPGHFQLSPAFRPGARFLCVAIEDGTTLGVGSLVEISAPSGQRFSRLAAVPGGRLAWIDRKGDFVELTVDGDPVGYRRKRESPSPVSESVVPQGRYLVLDPDVYGEPEDSRRLGLVPRADLRRKVIFTGFGS